MNGPQATVGGPLGGRGGGPAPVDGFENLAPTELRAVIINVGTELVTTLAIASVARLAACPLLVVDCGPSPSSRHVLSGLRHRFAFDVIERPITTHGTALDVLFRSLRDERVLLVDSDAEIRDPDLVARLRRSLDKPRVFGAGWYEGGRWMGHERFGAKLAVYHERMWMPAVMLRSEHVAAALAAGVSFERAMLFNDVRWSEPLSRMLARRFPHPHTDHSPLVDRLPPSIRRRVEQSSFPWLRWARSDWYGFRPNYVFADTGALVYGWCKRVRAWHFAGDHVDLMSGEVHHYGGVTRRALRANRFATPLEDIADGIVRRLREDFDIDWDTLRAAPGDRPT